MSDEKNNATEAPASAGMGTGGKIAIVAILAAAVVGVVWLKNRGEGNPAAQPSDGGQVRPPEAALPRLVDLGRGTCIPCKMMAPVLKELRAELAGKVSVEYIDIGEQPAEAERFKIQIIPTQIFLDASGAELFRHTGFYPKADILAKWRELGYDLGAASQDQPDRPQPGPSGGVVREEPLVRDARQPEQVCSMCEGTIEPKTRVTVDAPWGKASLCSVHCFAVYYSSLRDAAAVAGKATVTDWASGKGLPVEKAFYVRAIDKNSRLAAIRAFETKEAADAGVAARVRDQVQILAWDDLLKRELAVRCGFCDRAVYESDAAQVAVIEMQPSCCGGPMPVAVEWTWGCCPMCALGVAARRKMDVEIGQKDALTGETVRVRTKDFRVAILQPETAVAWHGQRKSQDGAMVSAGCFHQFFFASEGNLRQWLEKHPEESGRMLSIQQALDGKMKLTEQQIGNACKIGECRP